MLRAGSWQRRRGTAALAVAVGLTLAATPPALAQLGAEQFAKNPETPSELWEAADYLVRVGRSDQAAAFIQRFLESNPRDETLLQIRDRYGVGSILRLEDQPLTKGLGVEVIGRIREAAARTARDPERLQRLAGLLAATAEERVIALEGLRPSGSYAIAPILQVAADPGMKPEQRSAVLESLGALDRRALPALTALLDASDDSLAAAAARALGRIGDPRAIPFLVAAVSGAGTDRADLLVAASQALGLLKGGTAAAADPVRALTDEARRYLTGAYTFPEGPVEVWRWDTVSNAPAPQAMPADEAASTLGLKFAQQARALRPDDRMAGVVCLALLVDQATRKAGVAGFLADSQSETLKQARAAGPEMLSDVLNLAIAGRHWDVATVVATLLGEAAAPSRPGGPEAGQIVNLTPPPHALVKALGAPDRRTQFAAARALVQLDPPAAFPGSSQVVPVLSRFLLPYSATRAIVIDGNIHRGNELAAELKTLGFETEVFNDGPGGFDAANRLGDVELVFIEPTAIQGPWRLPDLLANLRADARTAGLPVLLHGLTEDIGRRMLLYTTTDPLTEYLIVPPDPGALGVQIRRIMDRLKAPRGLEDGERQELARSAAELLAEVAGRPRGAFVQDLPKAEAALASTLRTARLGSSSSATLAVVPTVDAQRDLAELALDPSRPRSVRVEAATRLAASLKRFGPLLTDSQERRLAQALDTESDAELRTAFVAAIRAMLRTPEPSGWPFPRPVAVPTSPAAPAGAG